MVTSPENIVGGYIVPLRPMLMSSLTSSGADVLVGDPFSVVVGLWLVSSTCDAPSAEMQNTNIANRMNGVD